MEIVVLHDRGRAPHQTLENLIQQKLIERKRVLNYSMFRTPDNLETDVEDLFQAALYVEAFNSAYARELQGALLTVADLPHHPRIVEQVNQWLRGKKISLLRDGGFNHYHVAQALLPGLTEQSLARSDFELFEKLFARVNGEFH